MNRRLITSLFVLLIFVSCGLNKRNEFLIEASGTIEATRVDISSKIGGQLIKLPVKEGMTVRLGDTLAVIDHKTLDLQLRQSLAGLELAQVQYNSDSKDDQRTKELYNNGSITEKQRDDSNARFRISSVKLKQARLAVELIRSNISDCFITSPLSGVISSTVYENGETIGPGAVIHSISKLDTVELVVYVNEQNMGYIKLNQEAEVRIDSFKDKVFPGRVVYISSEAEFTPKNIQTKQDRVKQVFGLKISLPNTGGELKPGIPADAVIKVVR